MRYPIFDQYCPYVDQNIQTCVDEMYRSSPTPEISSIILKIQGTSILNPSNYFTIIDEICRNKITFDSFLSCAYPYVQNCMGDYRDELLAPWRNFTYGFTYLCRYRGAKELNIECFKNNTLQGPVAKDRIMDFSNTVEKCRIDQSRTLPVSDSTNARQKTINDHCINYNVGYDCVRRIFADRCHRTRNHIKVFYDYLRPGECSAPFCHASIILLLCSLLITKYFL
ncbi:hypothetical protein LOTGIDRAFT_239621 [Lottia gigantea]|uniref:Uncharacterized protein n=1 Tax=Lottia gigantea TaxID=225164 RepID=V3ZBJ3_LOTGI|nr:hypothetical protein LOTGIDRAFT_239621 [Lottia gigantea]ESO88378.1 hypothetical protein LOTGIDRAFT_239621 [Lottia gigantea]